MRMFAFGLLGALLGIAASFVGAEGVGVYAFIFAFTFALAVITG